MPRLVHHQAVSLHALEFHQIIDIRLSSFHIISGVDAEHQHIDDAAFHRFQSDMGIVGAHTDVADDPFSFQFLGVGQNRPLKDRAEILFAVYIVDHAHINIVGVRRSSRSSKERFVFSMSRVRVYWPSSNTVQRCP